MICPVRGNEWAQAVPFGPKKDYNFFFGIFLATKGGFFMVKDDVNLVLQQLCRLKKITDDLALIKPDDQGRINVELNDLIMDFCHVIDSFQSATLFMIITGRIYGK